MSNNLGYPIASNFNRQNQRPIPAQQRSRVSSIPQIPSYQNQHYIPQSNSSQNIHTAHRQAPYQQTNEQLQRQSNEQRY